MSVLPFGRSGVISASMLGLGRALGETMAVATVLSPSFDDRRTACWTRAAAPSPRTSPASSARRDERRPGRADRLRPRAVRHHPAGQRCGSADHRPPQGVLGGQRMSDALPTTRRGHDPTAAPRHSLPSRGCPAGRRRAWPSARSRIACGIGLAAGLDSKIQWGLIAALLFIVGTYAHRRPGRGPPAGQGPAGHQPGLGIASCSPSSRWPRCCRTTVATGVKVLDVNFLTHSMAAAQPIRPGGGIYHAIIGTLEQVGIATAHRGADRHAHRGLPGRVRPRQARQGRDLLRRRHDRHPLDRRRPVHPSPVDPHPGLRLLRLRRRAGAGAS